MHLFVHFLNLGYFYTDRSLVKALSKKLRKSYDNDKEFCQIIITIISTIQHG